MVARSDHLKFWTNLLCSFIVLFGEDCYCQIYVHIQNNENKDSEVCIQHFTLKEITKSTPISNVGVIRNSSRPTSKPLMFSPLTL